MAQQLYPFDTFSVRELNLQLMKKLGYSIKSKSDCAKLSELIFKEGLGLISQSTLYRILLYDKAHKPFYNTLTIITQFLGYIDWEDFCKTIHRKKKLEYTNGHLSHTNLEKSLLYQCIQLENYRPLEALFNNIGDVEQEAKDSITLMLYDSLLSISDTMPFFTYFGNNTFIRESFFEYGVDPSFRIANYDEGFRIYLGNYTPDKSLLDLQSFIFGNCVLFRHYCVKGDWDKALGLGQTLYNTPLLSATEMESIYVFPRLRYLSLKLVYLKLTNANAALIEDYVHYLIDYAKTVYSSLTYIERRIVFYNLGDVFLQTNVNKFYQEQLKALFENEFALFPEGLLHKPLAKVLPYFEPNGLLQHRPT
ncbi:hypothetical protein [Flavobacterium sp. N1994]|uniref:hypothetical protein n=1 Tax=Flavobacterium sp. N1994 TaxID=2986827 RepID=UPI0022235799|nr:hypothetical protein [Flavobacterium sp. N1994]